MIQHLHPLLFLLAAAPAPASQYQPPAAMAGTWDLTWQTRRGPRREGYFVIRQDGERVEAEIHGRGAVKARGTVNGSAFALRGSRMAVPYRIDGRVSGAHLEGTIRILTVERRFTGTRRPPP
jgi:hypothetical protein